MIFFKKKSLFLIVYKVQARKYLLTSHNNITNEHFTDNRLKINPFYKFPDSFTLQQDANCMDRVRLKIMISPTHCNSNINSAPVSQHKTTQQQLWFQSNKLT